MDNKTLIIAGGIGLVGFYLYLNRKKPNVEIVPITAPVTTEPPKVSGSVPTVSEVASKKNYTEAEAGAKALKVTNEYLKLLEKIPQNNLNEENKNLESIKRSINELGLLLQKAELENDSKTATALRSQINGLEVQKQAYPNKDLREYVTTQKASGYVFFYKMLKDNFAKMSKSEVDKIVPVAHYMILSDDYPYFRNLISNLSLQQKILISENEDKLNPFKNLATRLPIGMFGLAVATKTPIEMR